MDEVAAQPGDAIEAVGFLELGGPAPVLREAAVRKIAVRICRLRAVLKRKTC